MGTELVMLKDTTGLPADHRETLARMDGDLATCRAVVKRMQMLRQRIEVHRQRRETLDAGK